MSVSYRVYLDIVGVRQFANRREGDFTILANGRE